MKAFLHKGLLVVHFSPVEASQIEELLGETGAPSDAGAASELYRTIQKFMCCSFPRWSIDDDMCHTLEEYDARDAGEEV